MGDSSILPSSCGRFRTGQDVRDVASAAWQIDGAGLQYATVDLDGNGLEDVAVGARDTVYLFDGPVSGVYGVQDADAVVSGEPSFGTGIGSAGDQTGDRMPDLWIGADNGGVGAGRVYFLPGPFSGVVDGSAALHLDGVPGDRLGYALDVAPDVTGDGKPDMIVDGLVDHVYVLGAPPVASGPIEDVATARIRSTAPKLTVRRAGDVTGDGVGDLVAIGHEIGTAWLLAGPLSGDVDVADASTTYNGVAEVGAVLWIDGESVASDSDVTGDGLPDVLVGDVNGGPDGTGIARLFDGSRRGSIDADTADAEIVEATGGIGFGRVSSAGDLDSDGVGDVVIAADVSVAYETFVWYGTLAGQHDTADADATFANVIQGTVHAYDVTSDTDGDGCRELWTGHQDVVYQLTPTP